LGISIDHAWLLQQRLKRQGIEMKAMPHNRPKFDHAAFARAWNAADSVAEVAHQFGISAVMARDRARKVRRAGIALKPMVKVIDVMGVAMTVREFCEMTGQSKSSVSERLTRGFSVLSSQAPQSEVKPWQRHVKLKLVK
jgi:hypothetical protein